MNTTTIADRVTRLEVRKADMIGSVFSDVDLSDSRFDDINMSGVKISDVNLSGGAIENARLDGFTIDGVLVTELFACWRANHKAADNA